MTHSEAETAKRVALEQGSALALGAATGALTKTTISPRLGQRGGFAVQVGSAMGVAAATGAGVSGTVSAGAAVVGAKVVAAGAMATAAAPFILGAAACYGIFRLIKKL